MGTAQRHLRAELDLSILETVSGKEGNVNQDTDHILAEISSTFFHNRDHMLAQIAGEPPLLICNCALPPQLFLLASEASEIACMETRIL